MGVLLIGKRQYTKLMGKDEELGILKLAKLMCNFASFVCCCCVANCCCVAAAGVFVICTQSGVQNVTQISGSL
jgi:hypothetical protein